MNKGYTFEWTFADTPKETEWIISPKRYSTFEDALSGASAWCLICHANEMDIIFHVISVEI